MITNKPRKFFKIMCDINGSEEVIRTAHVKNDVVKLTELEKKLNAFYLEVKQGEWLKLKKQLKQLNFEFIKPSKDIFLNGEMEFDALKCFREKLNELIDGQMYFYVKQRLFLHTQEINNFINKNK